MFTETAIRPLSRHVLSGATMGTRYSATFYAPDTLDIQSLSADLFVSVDMVDQQMSTWKPGSDLMRLNAAPVDEWVSIPTALATVLHSALEIGRTTNGAFDIGLGDIVDIWGFGANGKSPDPARIGDHLGMVRAPVFESLELDLTGLRARKLAPVTLDLSGIAKGFGVDQMMSCLVNHGIENALVGLDGELKSRGGDGPDKPWVIAVEKPDYQARAPLGVLPLEDAAIATSGDYRHWIDVGQMRLSHTMNRHTGGPLNTNLASVSVVAQSCMQADAWATALMVMGDIAGPALARARGMQVLFVARKNGGLTPIPIGPLFEGM